MFLLYIQIKEFQAKKSYITGIKTACDYTFVAKLLKSCYQFEFVKTPVMFLHNFFAFKTQLMTLGEIKTKYTNKNRYNCDKAIAYFEAIRIFFIINFPGFYI